MHVILTHEQADFDALASMLGAYLLNETAIPVLPRRINRNVYAFITLYGTEFPFIDAGDLPNKPIEIITLVDTQSLVSLKGMGPYTQVRVVDHHPKREDIPSHWHTTIAETGATATIFVEALREHNGHINTIQATLLLLGIYEDTGSLTYTQTTPRDLHAAAYLLEIGANLDIASGFLNHPLSKQQQALYERLLNTFETHLIHGHTVIVACGDAVELDEELSTVAHKLRDLLDPDALFLLITTRGGIQLIARSSSNRIDVARIAEEFGGGGHDRAAASLIRDMTMEQARSKLLQTLHEVIQPAITVAEIMSFTPQLITPETSVEEAAQRMQLYGFEGFPVVKDGKVIGLLTRRAVDRALAHKLNLTADRLMNAGEHTITPDASIEQLQRLMTTTGWGQIPVVHPETGEVIGIVTRTDLLKNLTGELTQTGRHNYSEKLETALPPARLALLKLVAQMAHEQRSALYIVGGFVRDLLLNRPSTDFDLVVEGDAIRLARALAKKYGGRVTSHARFGTAKWHLSENKPDSQSETRLIPTLETIIPSLNPEDLPTHLDLVTARTEFYTHPSALPTVERGSIKLDLHRRDFTINTLALRLDGVHYGELYDFWGGFNDLRQGIVRVLHSLSFVDDPTRILRAVRFEQRFGFKIEERTLELLLDARSLLDRISGDRIRHELDHILIEEQVCAILERLEQLGILKSIHHALIFDQWLCERLQQLHQTIPTPEWELSAHTKDPTFIQSISYILWMIRLNDHEAHSLITRLKCTRALAKDIHSARHIYKIIPTLSTAKPSQIVVHLDNLSHHAHYAVYLALGETDHKKLIENYLIHWKSVSPSITGHDLRNYGLQPGPIYRQILSSLRTAWLDGVITNREEERTLLEKLIKQAPKGNEIKQS